MKESVQKIQFKGRDFILTCPDDDNSPITTIEQYQKGECSYAHLYRKNGTIMRFRGQIGTIEDEDIEFGEVEVVEIEINLFEAMEGLVGDTWPI